MFKFDFIIYHASRVFDSRNTVSNHYEINGWTSNTLNFWTVSEGLSDILVDIDLIPKCPFSSLFKFKLSWFLWCTWSVLSFITSETSPIAVISDCNVEKSYYSIIRKIWCYAERVAFVLPPSTATMASMKKWSHMVWNQSWIENKVE